MALIIDTLTPKTLLQAIKKEIDSKNIETWIYDADGDFTHTPPQWKYKAWLRPHIRANKLSFGLLGNTNATMTKVVYGVYHGRFSEMLLTHFDDSFTAVVASAHKRVGLDNYKAV